MLDLLRPELAKRHTAVTSDDQDVAHLAIHEAFNATTGLIHDEIDGKSLRGGSTALMILETERGVCMHQMGDCRASLGDPQSGELMYADRAVIDGAFEPEIRRLGRGPVQTPIHAMPGIAVFRDGADEVEPVVCTKESMSRMRIEGDDEAETGHSEWMAFNIAYCTYLKEDHATREALCPRKDQNAATWRVSPCNTSVTRGIRGWSEEILRNGQTFYYSVPLSKRRGKVLVFGCDGVEDNDAVLRSQIFSVATSVDKMKELWDEKVLRAEKLKPSNKLQRCHPGYRKTYPSTGSFTDKLGWTKQTAQDLPVDQFWKDSVQKSAAVLQALFEDEEALRAAFIGNTSEDLKQNVTAFIEFCNLRCSADNVTFGVKKWY